MSKPTISAKAAAAAKAAAKAKISAGVAASWKNPKVAAARRERSAVEVDGVRYSSVYKAFVALDLPVSVHIPFRGELKAAGKLERFEMKWEIIPLNY